MDLYPRCMIKIEHETYKCSIGKFNKIIVKDENLPIVCHMCPLARELYSTPLVEGENIEDNKENKINIQYPSTIGLVKNFSKAMINYAKSGFKHISVEQYKDRLKVCQGDVGIPQCEHYDNGRCKHVDCGCFLSKKAWLVSENCPENKWPNHHDQQPDKQQGD